MARNSHIAGFIRVICGPMYAGKSDELIRRLARAKYAKVPYLTFKPSTDSRTINEVSSRNSTLTIPAITINQSLEILDYIQTTKPTPKIIAIDEAQFFDSQLIPVASFLAKHGFELIIAGLDKDFKGEPFRIVADLCALADEVTKLSSICTKCSKEAVYSQRLINNQPADYNSPIVLIGDHESYCARCRDCFEIPGSLWETDPLYQNFKTWRTNNKK